MASNVTRERESTLILHQGVVPLSTGLLISVLNMLAIPVSVQTNALPDSAHVHKPRACWRGWPSCWIFQFLQIFNHKEIQIYRRFFSLKYVSVGTVQSKIMDLKLRNFYNKKISALYSPLLIKNTINKTLS